MTAATQLPQILVIDDEMGPRESLRMLLKPNYQVHTADCVEAGIKLLKEKQPDTIVMDIRMPGVSGIEGLRQIREIDPNLSVIMLTGFGALETAKEALRLGANDYISKPFDAHEMQQVIDRNVERTAPIARANMRLPKSRSLTIVYSNNSRRRNASLLSARLPP